MSGGTTYDVIIAGGGIAGLSLAIQLSRKRYNVLVLEKESYPKHKVCGEYISMESEPFIRDLGVSITELELPIISRLQVTDARGNEVNEPLPVGGFGISRYMLDDKLAGLARQAGATLLTKTRVEDIQFNDDRFSVHTRDQVYQARLVCGAWGKRSNLDMKLDRDFARDKSKTTDNHVGVKYHISYPWPKDLIALHNFRNGYCGVSSIEDDKVCLCYLTTARNLHDNGNDIHRMERDTLMKNEWLREIFSEATFLYEAPIAISQVSFLPKEQVLNHILLTGDTAGMISPLCGNGMSMALHATKLVTTLADEYLRGTITRATLEAGYQRQWNNIFAKRLAVGRFVQRNFGKDLATSLLLKSANLLPFARKALVAGAAGKAF